MKDKPNTHQFSYEEIFGAEGTCGHQATAFQYFDNALTQEEGQRFRDHLKGCAVCAALLAGLQESEIAASGTILDSAQAERIFEKTRGKLQQQTSPPFVPQRKFSFSPSMHGVIGVLAVALLLSLYGNYTLRREVTELVNQNRQAPQEIETTSPPVLKNNQRPEPDVSATVIYPVRLERSSKTGAIPLSFNETIKSRMVVFALSSIEYPRYELKIERADQVVWQREIDGATLDPASPLISIHFYSGFLTPGDYRFKIAGLQNGKRITIGEYPMIVRQQ